MGEATQESALREASHISYAMSIREFQKTSTTRGFSSRPGFLSRESPYHKGRERRSPLPGEGRPREQSTSHSGHRRVEAARERSRILPGSLLVQLPAAHHFECAPVPLAVPPVRRHHLSSAAPDHEHRSSISRAQQLRHMFSADNPHASSCLLRPGPAVHLPRRPVLLPALLVLCAVDLSLSELPVEVPEQRIALQPPPLPELW